MEGKMYGFTKEERAVLQPLLEKHRTVHVLPTLTDNWWGCGGWVMLPGVSADSSIAKFGKSRPSTRQLEEALRAYLEARETAAATLRRLRVSLIAIDPETAECDFTSSTPGYDPNHFIIRGKIVGSLDLVDWSNPLCRASSYDDSIAKDEVEEIIRNTGGTLICLESSMTNAVESYRERGFFNGARNHWVNRVRRAADERAKQDLITATGFCVAESWNAHMQDCSMWNTPDGLIHLRWYPSNPNGSGGGKGSIQVKGMPVEQIDSIIDYD